MWLNQQTVNLSPLGFVGSTPSIPTKLKQMKKLLLIFIFALIGCTADEAPRECDCRLVEHGSSDQGHDWIGTSYDYQDDNCSNNGKLVETYVEESAGILFTIEFIVECN